MELRDVIEWCDKAGLQEWVMLLDHLVVLLRNAIILQEYPTPITSIQDVITQTLTMRQWHIASLAQATHINLDRLLQLLSYEGSPPSRDEIATLSSVAVKPDGSEWTTEELDVLARIQYGELYYRQYTSLPLLILRNWDLLCSSPIPIERLQVLRDGGFPSETEVLRLALWLRLDEEFVRRLAEGAIA